MFVQETEQVAASAGRPQSAVRSELLYICEGQIGGLPSATGEREGKKAAPPAKGLQEVE